MARKQPDLVRILTTDHPARPYYLAGGALLAVGVLRTRVSGLILLAVGVALLQKANEATKPATDLSVLD
ncbi:hypothetical protein EON81_16425 [bacterium]|nr:MAG: hypothetical protein EON81_16425 [bacterium]